MIAIIWTFKNCYFRGKLVSMDLKNCITRLLSIIMKSIGYLSQKQALCSLDRSKSIAIIECALVTTGNMRHNKYMQ